MTNIKNLKILFGGAFNPPTYAHYKIGDIFVNEYNAEITYLPSSSIYNKNVEIIDYKYRYDMLKLIIDKIGHGAYISDYEKTQTEYKGTYQTLKDFKDYYFLIGYDQLVNLPNWINFKALVEENKFIVIPRSGYNIDEVLENEVIKSNIDNFIFVSNFPVLKSSSTEFRTSHDKELVTSEVYEYIKENKLYGVK